jgi:adenylate kinase family enzyme
MTKPRIHIIGGPGSGRSSVAGELSRRLGVPAYDLDDLFWDTSASRYGVRAEVAERNGRLAAIVAQDGWIIEGVYYGWLAPSFDADDRIIELSPSIWIRYWRVLRRFALRTVLRNASQRESVADLWRLLRWSHSYDRQHLREAHESMAARGRQVIACSTPEQVFLTTSDLRRAAADGRGARSRSQPACGRTKQRRDVFHFRAATIGDADSVADVYLRSRRELLACAPLVHSEDEVREWIRRHVIPAGCTTVALADDRVVGFMAVSRGTDSSWIDQLAV